MACGIDRKEIKEYSVWSCDTEDNVEHRKWIDRETDLQKRSLFEKTNAKPEWNLLKENWETQYNSLCFSLAVYQCIQMLTIVVSHLTGYFRDESLKCGNSTWQTKPSVLKRISRKSVSYFDRFSVVTSETFLLLDAFCRGHRNNILSVEATICFEFYTQLISWYWRKSNERDVSERPTITQERQTREHDLHICPDIVSRVLCWTCPCRAKDPSSRAIAECRESTNNPWRRAESEDEANCSRNVSRR